MRPRYKQINDPILLNITKLHNNHILFFFLCFGNFSKKTFSNFLLPQRRAKWLLQDSFDKETNLCFSRQLYQKFDVFATTLVTMILPIVSLRVTTLLFIFFIAFLSRPPFFKYFQRRHQTKFFQRHFLLLIQLKRERKISDFEFFLVLNSVNFCTLFFLNKLLIK